MYTCESVMTVSAAEGLNMLELCWFKVLIANFTDICGTVDIECLR